MSLSRARWTRWWKLKSMDNGYKETDVFGDFRCSFDLPLLDCITLMDALEERDVSIGSWAWQPPHKARRINRAGRMQLQRVPGIAHFSSDADAVVAKLLLWGVKYT